MELTLNHTVVFSKNLNAFNSGKRFLINQGGGRSSKTYSIIQLLIFIALTEPKTTISIIRKSFPSLRGSVMRDFITILDELGLYSKEQHHKTENIYRFDNGSQVEFFSIDDAQKIRGRKRHICYCNEANELVYDDFLQLTMRTEKCLILDFNPSDTEHWIYDLIKDERSILIKSTYKDNIYLPDSLKQEIENLINVDENYYKIYALGEKPTSNTRVYTHFQQFIDLPNINDWAWGLDFGYTHPSALVKCFFIDNKTYVYESLYQSNLTSGDLSRKVKEIITDNKPIYCDTARPEIIEDLKRLGLNVRSANKDVVAGINSIRSKEIYIHHESINILKEYKKYNYKMKGELITEEVIKEEDDLMDAMRYCIHTHTKKGNVDYLRFY